MRPGEDKGGMSKEEEEEEEEEVEEKSKKKTKDKDRSAIRSAVEELSLVEHQGKASTLAFLAVSNLLLQFLDKIGPTVAVLRHDIRRNIERLEDVYVLDASGYSSLVDIIKKEVSEGTARKSDSCTRATLWLTRYKVALKLIPEKKLFISLLMGKGQDQTMLKPDIQNLVSLVQPLLTDIHANLKKLRLDRLKST
ncbi:glycolipid transfer protein 3 isoform X2 [Musa acuminata AAA Group]|uniref:glycolipid transfer protein 3 isoform X2 n=1 Tax=Musa acuminata AAA Group TaxID=214697 RepID=UPI0031D1F29B